MDKQYKACEECSIDITSKYGAYCELCKPYMVEQEEKENKMSHYRKITVKDREFEWCSCCEGTLIRNKELKINLAVWDYDIAKHVGNPDGYWKDEEFRVAVKPSYVAKYIEENLYDGEK